MRAGYHRNRRRAVFLVNIRIVLNNWSFHASAVVLDLQTIRPLNFIISQINKIMDTNPIQPAPENRGCLSRRMHFLGCAAQAYSQKGSINAPSEVRHFRAVWSKESALVGYIFLKHAIYRVTAEEHHRDANCHTFPSTLVLMCVYKFDPGSQLPGRPLSADVSPRFPTSTTVPPVRNVPSTRGGSTAIADASGFQQCTCLIPPVPTYSRWFNQCVVLGRWRTLV